MSKSTYRPSKRIRSKIALVWPVTYVGNLCSRVPAGFRAKALGMCFDQEHKKWFHSEKDEWGVSTYFLLRANQEIIKRDDNN